MKRILLSLSGFLAIFIMFPALASAISSETIIAGNVCNTPITDCGPSIGTPVSGANVTVTCDGNQLTTVTTGAGAYGVQFIPASLCPDGANATVAASKGSENGSNSGTVNNAVNSDETLLNVAIVNVSLVPELGLLTGIVAVIVAGGSFMVIRRRKLSESKK